VPRGRIPKLGITKDDKVVTYRVPGPKLRLLEADAAAAHVSVNELCRARALAPYDEAHAGNGSMSTQVPVMGMRDLTVEPDPVG
jgi:hypothetical protein